MKIIAQLQKQAKERKFVLLNQVPFENPLATLFDLAVYFEEQYGNLGPSGSLQVAGVALSRMIKDLFSLRKNYPNACKEEQAHQKLLERLLTLHEKGFDKRLIELCQTYESIESLEELKQIQQYDENCEVKEYAEGCFRTLIKEGRFEYFQQYIKDGLKIETATEYYSNLGRTAALKMVHAGVFVPQGANEDDQADSFEHLAEQIATMSCIKHYGIEENFKLEGKEYSTSLLIQIISFLIVYTSSRYGHSYEEQTQETSVIERIFKVWKVNLEKDGRITPGPLFIDTWESFTGRLSSVIKNSTPDEIEQHLALITTLLDGNPHYVNIFEKPMLRLGRLVVFFARPFMLQNGWMPVLLPLLKNNGKKEPEGKGDRVRRSTANLAEKFRQHDFKVLVDEKLPNLKEPGRILTDVDVMAMKGDWLVILQIKMTHPRANLQEAASHKNQLEKAGGQMVKTMGYLEDNWPEFRKKFGSGKEWTALKTIPLVVTTSFEFDRERFFGYLKVSQFELERYLENENLTGALLQELIQSDALWRDLDPIVAAKSIDRFLPEGCIAGSDANKAEERFHEGNLRYGRQDYAGADAMYREAIHLFPQQEKYYKGLGNALVMQGRRNESFEYFNKAIELNPCYGEGYNARGLTYAEMETYDKAYKDFQQATRFSPGDISAWSHIAQLQFARAQKLFIKQFFLEAKQLAKKGLFIFAHLTVEEQELHFNSAEILTDLSRL